MVLFHIPILILVRADLYLKYYRMVSMQFFY